MFVQTLCLTLAKRVGAFLLGAIVLWHVAEHCGATRGRAIVHVAVPRVDLMVDEVRYSVDSLWETPIVCDLRPGRHTVQMLRNGRVLYREEFTIGGGEEIVLSAWDGYDDGRSARSRD